MKGIGWTLLLAGAGLIAYAFCASDSMSSTVSSAVNSANSALSQILATLPPNRTLWLLLGGSGAVILGMAMIFKRPAGNKN